MEEPMDTTKTQVSTPEAQTKDEPIPLQVFQFADGYMAIFRKHIAYGGGKSPYSNEAD
jgi:hypothetical protein